VLVGTLREADGRLKEAAEPTVPILLGNRSREPGPVFKLSVVTVGLTAGFGMILFPIRSSALFRGSWSLAQTTARKGME
jgi:hypothetical protein